MDLPGRWIDRAHRRRKLTRLVLDMNSSVSETYGRQQGTAYNGHFGCTCYHPLFVFNQFGDLERVMLRLRLKANAVLERHIAHLLKRLVGRPSKRPKVFYHAFRYRAKSWDRARRVVAKVEWHAGELFPRVGFVVTDLRRSPKRVVKFYNGRGTVEQWIKEGKNALKWTRLSCHRFKDNQARLQLFALAYNLGNFLRQIALTRPVRTWTQTTLREMLIKIGAKVVRHAKALTFQMAEVAVPRALLAAILGRIGRLRVAPSPG